MERRTWSDQVLPRWKFNLKPGGSRWGRVKPGRNLRIPSFLLYFLTRTRCGSWKLNLVQNFDPWPPATSPLSFHLPERLNRIHYVHYSGYKFSRLIESNSTVQLSRLRHSQSFDKIMLLKFYHYPCEFIFHVLKAPSNAFEVIQHDNITNCMNEFNSLLLLFARAKVTYSSAVYSKT